MDQVADIGAELSVVFEHSGIFLKFITEEAGDVSLFKAGADQLGFPVTKVSELLETFAKVL